MNPCSPDSVGPTPSTSDSSPRQPWGKYRFVLRGLAIGVGLVSLLVVWRMCFARIEDDGDLVRAVNINLPASSKAMKNALWNIRRGSRPVAHEFVPLDKRDWKVAFKERKDAMIQEARSSGRDFRSLDACLSKVLEHAKTKDLVYLPVVAYRVRRGADPVWVLVVDWEAKCVVDRGVPVGHIRFFAYDATSLGLIGFATCD